MAKYYKYGENDVILTVATDPAWMYASDIEMQKKKYFNNNFDVLAAAETFGQHLKATTVDHFIELDHIAKERCFNLGYFTWVEQQGILVEDFMARKNQKYW